MDGRITRELRDIARRKLLRDSLSDFNDVPTHTEGKQVVAKKVEVPNEEEIDWQIGSFSVDGSNRWVQISHEGDDEEIIIGQTYNPIDAFNVSIALHRLFKDLRPHPFLQGLEKKDKYLTVSSYGQKANNFRGAYLMKKDQTWSIDVVNNCPGKFFLAPARPLGVISKGSNVCELLNADEANDIQSNERVFVFLPPGELDFDRLRLILGDTLDNLPIFTVNVRNSANVFSASINKLGIFEPKIIHFNETNLQRVATGHIACMSPPMRDRYFRFRRSLVDSPIEVKRIRREVKFHGNHGNTGDTTVITLSPKTVYCNEEGKIFAGNVTYQLGLYRAALEAAQKYLGEEPESKMTAQEAILRVQVDPGYRAFLNFVISDKLTKGEDNNG